MIIQTNLHARDYLETEVCRIINPKQQRMYIKNKAFPIDIYSSIDEEGNDIIVMIFLKSETKRLYEMWNGYELE